VEVSQGPIAAHHLISRDDARRVLQALGQQNVGLERVRKEEQVVLDRELVGQRKHLHQVARGSQVRRRRGRVGREPLVAESRDLVVEVGEEHAH
jgi:hypothetical protein